MNISIFDENVEYYKTQINEKTGNLFTSLEAKNKARDYYNRYTAREITSGWLDRAEMHESRNADPLQYEEFNDLVEKIFNHENCVEKAKKIFALMIRLNNLEQFLYEELKEKIVDLVGDYYPTKNQDIATAVGFKIQKSGGCASLNDYKKRIRYIARTLVS